MTEFPILSCETPATWCQMALDNIETLLLDHAHCEKKAASTALALIYRYPMHSTLIERMSKLAREELRHFEQVVKIMRQREISFTHLPPSRYAQGLLKHVSTYEPNRLVDTLLVGAFVEARSCERFAALVPLLDDELAKFYGGLLASEARHYQHYINFAEQLSDTDLSERVDFFSTIERDLILEPDPQFRFHSGTPS